MKKLNLAQKVIVDIVLLAIALICFCPPVRQPLPNPSTGTTAAWQSQGRKFILKYPSTGPVSIMAIDSNQIQAEIIAVLAFGTFLIVAIGLFKKKNNQT